jgi:hypothetical protein
MPDYQSFPFHYGIHTAWEQNTAFGQGKSNHMSVTPDIAIETIEALPWG